MTLNLDFSKKVRFVFTLDIEASTYDNIKVTTEIDGKILEKELTFTPLLPRKWCPKKHRMYVLNCISSFDASEGSSFVVELSDNKSANAPTVYQVLLSGRINELKYNHDLVPLAYREEIKTVTVTDAVINEISKKHFDIINKKYFEGMEQNDVVEVVEKIDNTDLVVTSFEPVPGVVVIPIKTEKSETIESTPKTEFERLLVDVDNMIQVAQDDKLAYVDRSRANTKLAVYASTLSNHLHQISSQYVREKYIAEKEYYRLYHEFLNDAKNMEGNNKKPSAAAADAYATQLTLDLYEAADLSEELSKYVNLRLKTIFEITRSVLQEVANAKKEIETTKQLT